MLLDDNHFSGLNKIQETIKQELLKKEIEPEVEKASAEPFKLWGNNHRDSNNQLLSDFEEQQKNVAIEEKTEDVKKDVKEQELKPEQIKPNFFQKLFNRLYFSISTGCLLGFGDIYPITNISKTISILQALFTVSLILS